MRVFQSSHYSWLPHKRQLKCQVGIMTLFVLSLVDLSAQALPQPRREACNLIPFQNKNSLCVCSPTQVVCVDLQQRLTAVPVNIVGSTKILNLQGNHIETIEENDFVGLEHLQTLDLENNLIEYIHENAFKNMYRLMTLNLRNNRLAKLDPSGLTFQYLSSLEKLNLSHNDIKEINKDSFFTMIASNRTIEVNMDQNPTKCDCNVLAIRSLEIFYPESNFQLLNFKCANDDKQRSYKEATSSVFGECNNFSREDDTETHIDVEVVQISAIVTHDDIFSQSQKCTLCHDERTNDGCDQQGEMTCKEDEMMCHRGINWYASHKVMSISSSCVSRELCLEEAAKNKDSCGTDYLPSGNVNCNFCCHGSKCGNNHLGGRTTDFTLLLSYTVMNRQYQTFMSDRGHPRFMQEEARLDEGIRHSIHDFQGGMDIYVFKFVRKENDQINVFLRLEVTTFNTATVETVMKNITQDLLRAILERGTFLHGENIVQGKVKINPFDGDSSTCPENVSSYEDKGDILWNASPVGSYSKPCPYNNLLNHKVLSAQRTCLTNSDGFLVWDDADYSLCPSKKSLEIVDPEKIFIDGYLSQENAKDVSNWLNDYTANLDNVTLDSLNNTLKLLEQFANEEVLQLPGVVTNVVGCLSNLMNIDEKTMMELESKASISKRLVDVIGYISEKAPLVGGQLTEVTPNLVIAAQGVNASETHKRVVLTANYDMFRGFSADKVKYGYCDGNVSNQSGRSNMVIPILAIIDSLTSAGKMNTNINISRVSFTVHQSDKLFIAMKQTSSEVPQANTTPVYECDKNNSFDCQRQNASLLITKINSQVYAASIPGVVVQNLTENVTVRFVHTDINARNPRCVFWNQNLSNGTGDWSDEGCDLIESNSSESTCSCNHLTNFALLMDVYQGSDSVSDLDKKILSIISYVGCGISLFALILTLLTYTIFRSWRQSSSSFYAKSSSTNVPELKLRRDNPSKILINLCVALLLSNLIFLVGMRDYTFDNTASCKVVAVLMHYFLLASLTWMAVEAFYMYLALILVFKTYFTNFLLKCSLVGWGVPLVVVALTLGINSTENYGFIKSGMCWLRDPAFYAAFVGPVCLILLINCLAFGLVVRQLMSSTKLTKTDRNSTMQRLRGAVGVVILLGLTWLFAIFAIGQANVVFYYFFAVFNSLQGLFIFIFYCLLKKDASLSWRRSLPCFEEYGETSKSSSNSKAMTAKAASHHLVNKHDNRSRSGSSTFMANTVSSSLIDSRKNSKVNANHPDDSSEECDITVNAETLAGTADYKHKISPLLIPPKQQNSSISGTDKPPSYTALEYGDSSNDLNSSTKHSHKVSTNNGNLQENHESSPSQSQSVVSESPTSLSKGSFLPTATDVTTVSCPSESNNLKLESHQEKESPNILSPKTKGEIDHSNQPKVGEVILKFEHSNSEKTKDISFTHL